MRTRMRRISGMATAVALSATANGLMADAAQAAPTPATCYEVGSPDFAEFRQKIADFVATGKLSKEVGDAVICDPRTAAQHVTMSVRKVPSATAAKDMTEADTATDSTAADESAADAADADARARAVGQRMSFRWNITFSLGGELGRHWQTLNWSYNSSTKKVSEWGGECGGSTTKWGRLNGWRWDGCSQNDFIPYTLNGSYPGGVHHKTQGKWDNVFPYSDAKYLRLDIWGHYDGSCDTKYNSTLRHYC